MPTTLPERKPPEENPVTKLSSIALGTGFITLLAIPVVWILVYTATSAVRAAWGCSP